MKYNIIVSPYQQNIVDTKYSFKQNDYGATLSITVEDYDTTGTTAKIVFRRSDEAIREYNITKSSDGTYNYNLSADEIYSPGKVIVDLKFYKNNVRESTASFIYHVMQDKLGQTFGSGDYSDSISRAIERCDQAVANIQEQANKAIEDVENALLAELNIYDGYDKTTVGFAADARQLNENVANTYAAKIKAKIDANTKGIGDVNNNFVTEARSITPKITTSYLDYNVYKLGRVVFVSALFITAQECPIGTPLLELQDAPIHLVRVDLSIDNAVSKRADFGFNKLILNQSSIPNSSTITLNFSYITA